MPGPHDNVPGWCAVSDSSKTKEVGQLVPHARTDVWLTEQLRGDAISDGAV